MFKTFDATGIPVIKGGDHATFELIWPNDPASSQAPQIIGQTDSSDTSGAKAQKEGSR